MRYAWLVDEGLATKRRRVYIVRSSGEDKRIWQNKARRSAFLTFSK
jgi:hypothetical protein